jgi:hypothetical protein
MHLPCRAVLPAPVPPCLTPPRRERHALETLKVVFSIMGDLIRVHDYDNHYSAIWDAVLTYGRLDLSKAMRLSSRSGRTSEHGWIASALLPPLGTSNE